MFNLRWISTSSIPIHRGLDSRLLRRGAQTFLTLAMSRKRSGEIKRGRSAKSGGKWGFLCLESNFPLIFISFYLSWNSELVWLASSPVQHALLPRLWFRSMFSRLLLCRRRHTNKNEVRRRRSESERSQLSKQKVHGSFLIYQLFLRWLVQSSVVVNLKFFSF